MKRPSFQFYPSDWLRDTSLRSCSVEARGLWMDMLCYMHEGYPYGYLRAGKKVILPVNLASMTGLTLVVIERLLQELREAEVFSISEDGCMYSRRMVRDEQIRSKRAAGGHLGGNPALKKKKKKDNQKVNLIDNLTPEDEYEEVKENIGKGVQGERIGLWPDSDDLGMDIPEIKVGSVIQLISAAQQIHLTNDQVRQMWQAFKAQHFTGEKHYKSLNEIYSHFINWSKSQKIKDAKSASKATSGRSSGTVSYLERIAAEYAARGSGNDAG